MCEKAEMKIIQRLFQGMVSEIIDRCLESQLVEKAVAITEKKAINEGLPIPDYMQKRLNNKSKKQKCAHSSWYNQKKFKTPSFHAHTESSN